MKLNPGNFPRGRMPHPPDDPTAYYDAQAAKLVEAFKRQGAGGISIDEHQYRSYFRNRLRASPDPAARVLAAALDRRFGLS